MSMWFCAVSLALGGELMVMAPGSHEGGPVVVKVDGTRVEPVPGMPVVQVVGLAGIHKVEIQSAGGQLLQAMNVSVPPQGTATLVYDGRKLALVPAGAMPPAPGKIESAQEAPKGPLVVTPPAPRAMDEASFLQLVGAVEGEPFSSDKLNHVRTAASRSYFTIDQVGRLIDLLSFGADQIELVQICQPKVIDPQNAFSLGAHFSFSADREAALKLFQ